MHPLGAPGHVEREAGADGGQERPARFFERRISSVFVSWLGD